MCHDRLPDVDRAGMITHIFLKFWPRINDFVLLAFTVIGACNRALAGHTIRADEVACTYPGQRDAHLDVCEKEH